MDADAKLESRDDFLNRIAAAPNWNRGRKREDRRQIVRERDLAIIRAVLLWVERNPDRWNYIHPSRVLEEIGGE